MALTCTNVTLRQKALRNDRISLYLDYYPAIRNPYTMKMSRREFLGIYIYAKPRNEQQRMFNQEMLNKAEAIRCIRVQRSSTRSSASLTRTNRRSIFSPTSDKRHANATKSGIAYATTSRSFAVANVPSEILPLSCAKSFAIICSNASRYITPTHISLEIRQQATTQHSEPC